MEPTVRIELTTDGLQNHCSTTELCWQKVAPRSGLEPETVRLTAECSTIELSRN